MDWIRGGCFFDMSFQPSDLRPFMQRAAASLRTFVQWLRGKNVLKGLRISYQVAWNLFLVFIVFVLTGAFFAFGAGAGYFASLVKDQKVLSHAEMEKSIHNYTTTSDVYFADNVYLGKMRSDLRREEVELSDVSEHVKHALIATEDRYFYEHEGVVPKATMRALFQELTNAPIITGGSTITQQLVKNQMLTPEVSFHRKAQEMLYALRIERHFSKNDILNAYLNVVPFGRNASGQNIAGIQAAAQGVFGVDAKDLRLPQAAYLAGMPKNPFKYTPFKNSGGVKEDISEGIERMKTVLTRMRDAGFITEKQFEEAVAYDIRSHLREEQPSTYEKYPSLTTEIRRRTKHIIAKQIANEQGKDGEKLAEHAHLYEKYLFEQKHPDIGTIDPDLEKRADQLEKDAEQFARYLEIANERISRNGYTIHTTIDKDIYDAYQKVARTYNYGPRKPFCYDTGAGRKCDQDPKTGKTKQYSQQVANMLIENDTGAILAYVPGRNHDELELNLATQAYRSNGSTMKPLGVYGPAMEMGIAQPGSIVADLPYAYRDGTPVNNFGFTYHGMETVREALHLSHNIPAVKTFTKVMNQGNPREFLQKMGVTSLVGAGGNQSFGIGGLSKGVSVEENTNAFATFANGGEFIDAYMIEKIVDADGDVIFEHEPDPVRVFSAQTSYLMIDMLRDVLKRGTATAIPSMLGFQADWAGKTGTSTDVYDEWFVGLNPNVTLGVWLGYEKQIEMDYGSAARRTQELWAKFANAAYKVRPKLIAPDDRFHMPGGIVRRTVCGISGKLASDLCREAGLATSDLFNAKFAPNETGDALNKGTYVIVNGEKYAAHEHTPAPFTEEGVIVRGAYLEKNFLDVSIEQFYNFLPKDWEHVVPAKELKENGKRPAAVKGVSLKDGLLQWQSHPESDIVGYRVYAKSKGDDTFRNIGDVKASENSSYATPSGAHEFYVTAVDIDGQESNRSKTVKSGDRSKPDDDGEKQSDIGKKTDENGENENGDNKATDTGENDSGNAENEEGDGRKNEGGSGGSNEQASKNDE